MNLTVVADAARDASSAYTLPVVEQRGKIWRCASNVVEAAEMAIVESQERLAR